MSKLVDQFHVPLSHVDLSPQYNIAPSQQVLALRQATDGSGRQITVLKWGLIPAWADDPKIGNRMINARSETAAEKPAFRTAMQKRRCLILADGFYEWQKRGSKKQPVHISLRSGEPFAFAGLWEHWRRGDQSVDSCTVLTTDANDLLALIHDRMPVIVPPAFYDHWLDPSVTHAKELAAVLRPYDSEAMQAVAVGTTVNNPANDNSRCLESQEVGHHDGRLFAG